MTVDEKLDQLIADVAAIKESLKTAPSAPVATDPDAEFWKMFLAAPNPDHDTFQPEAFEVYDRSRVLYQMRAGYNVKGVSTGADVTSRMALVRSLWEPNNNWASAFQRNNVQPETAVYAILGGHVDDLVDAFKRGWYVNSSAFSQISILNGKTAEQLFAKDIAVTSGGTPGGGGNDSSTGSVPPRGV